MRVFQVLFFRVPYKKYVCIISLHDLQQGRLHLSPAVLFMEGDHEHARLLRVTIIGRCGVERSPRAVVSAVFLFGPDVACVNGGDVGPGCLSHVQVRQCCCSCAIARLQHESALNSIHTALYRVQRDTRYTAVITTVQLGTINVPFFCLFMLPTAYQPLTGTLPPESCFIFFLADAANNVSTTYRVWSYEKN